MTKHIHIHYGGRAGGGKTSARDVMSPPNKPSGPIDILARRSLVTSEKIKPDLLKNISGDKAELHGETRIWEAKRDRDGWWTISKMIRTTDSSQSEARALEYYGSHEAGFEVKVEPVPAGGYEITFKSGEVVRAKTYSQAKTLIWAGRGKAKDAGRLVHTETQGTATVKVYWEPTDKEYMCRLFVNGKENVNASYFTDSLDDAKATAKEMAKRADTLAAKHPVVFTGSSAPGFKGKDARLLALCSDAATRGTRATQAAFAEVLRRRKSKDAAAEWFLLTEFTKQPGKWSIWESMKDPTTWQVRQGTNVIKVFRRYSEAEAFVKRAVVFGGKDSKLQRKAK